MTLLILALIAILIYYLAIYKSNILFGNSDVQLKCPNCDSKVEKEFNVCPICKESLKKTCANCNEIIESHWNYCPYCESKVKKDDRI